MKQSTEINADQNRGHGPSEPAVGCQPQDLRPELIRALQRWFLCSGEGSNKPPPELVLEDLLLDERKLMEAISWSLQADRLLWLLELRKAVEKFFHRYSLRSDFTFAETLKLMRLTTRQIDSIRSRMELRAACAKCPVRLQSTKHIRKGK